MFANAPVREMHPEISEAERFAPAPNAEEVAVGSGFGAPGSGQVPPAPSPQPRASMQHAGPKVGRNDPCPCGSGKKYKKCHGQ